MAEDEEAAREFVKLEAGLWKVGTQLQSADDDEVLRILRPDYAPLLPMGLSTSGAQNGRPHRADREPG